MVRRNPGWWGRLFRRLKILEDDSLEDLDDPPWPDVIAREIVEDLIVTLRDVVGHPAPTDGC